MRVDIQNIDVKRFLAVIFGYLLYPEHRLKFLELMLHDIFFPHIVCETFRSMVEEFDAIVTITRLADLGSTISEEEVLTFRSIVGEVQVYFAETLQRGTGQSWRI